MTYRKQTISLHLLMVLMIIIISMFVFYKSMVRLRGQLDEIRINSVHQIQQVGREYDMILQSNEKLLAESLNKGMSSVREAVQKDGYGKLWETAKSNKLDKIIITDMKGEILASANPNNNEQNITHRIPEFVSFIDESYNQNRILVDRVGMLIEPDRLYKTAFYVDVSENLVYIAAVDFQKWLEKENGISFSNYLLRDYFNSLSHSIMLVSDVSLYYEQGAELHSEGGEENLEMFDLTDYAYESIESQIFNNKETIIVPYHLVGMSDMNRLWLKINFDIHKIRQISTNLLLRTLLSFVILAMVIYLSIFFFYRNMREERKRWILDVIEKVKNDEFDENTIEKGVFDEEIEKGIFSLTKSINIHSEAIRKKLADNESAVGKLRRQLESEKAKEVSMQKQMKALETSCEQLQRYDTVTGLPNKDTMRDIIIYERERAERTKKEFSLMILKIVNHQDLQTEYGEDMGNYLLNKIGAKLKALLRKQDQVARWGDSEYMLLMPMTHSEGLRCVVARVEQMLDETEFFWQERRIILEQKMGAALFKSGMPAENLIKQTEVAIADAVNKKQNIIID